MTTITTAVRPLVPDPDGDRALLGGKAWGIQRMLALGVPVPPAFVVTTEACARHRVVGGRLPADVRAALPAAIAYLEEATGRTFGCGPTPLLVSVRSGAAVSMPGMMDTVLNLGMTPRVQVALAVSTGNARFAADTARRFTRQFEAVVGVAPPAEPAAQLEAAVSAVFASWDSRRALAYRRERGLDDDAGTAVTVQAMVFGNLDDASGTGVLFTRDPLTGDPEPFGERLPRGQGEDVVAGTHDPLRLTELARAQPAVHAELMALAATLERECRDVQDIEFTVESGRLWLLQTRAAKRSPAAAVRLAVALAEEGLIGEREALDRVSPGQVAAVLRPHVEPHARAAARVLASGRPACPGVVSGVVVCDTEAAQDRADAGEAVVLARPTTDPEDVPAMSAVAAILTELGGATSHAAVVSRELGVPCVVGCGTGTLMGLAGTEVTVDAAAGEVFGGVLPVVAPTGAGDEPDLARLLAWARAEPGADPAASLPDLLTARDRTR
ncbi:pyruvate, phosphate dikinase [Protofrankia symbiont of Coriaria myrtifolia]|uniref:pyruvate, phosphate dikinase n=1 Tax=Protofrankia symbiont of Coriaria myrtifolia TaxID=1306540 RepID=UPI0010413AD0|nr:pyruvate, phosphate dikinase [Protofrankia symbiont of Coriaria myrtifolia]